MGYLMCLFEEIFPVDGKGLNLSYSQVIPL